LESWRRKKWLEIADRYPRLGAEEQTRIQERMRAWATLTPEQRKAAREKYKNLQKASPEQREALMKKWLKYDALPDEEKKRFSETAARKPVVNPVLKPAGGHSIVRPSSVPARPIPAAAVPASGPAAPPAPVPLTAPQPAPPPASAPAAPAAASLPVTH
jgi:hypothetical protein